ncbi:MAG TPA: DUF4091 domain-containing protein [Candidatus Brocadiia bacterium]|nr:DUF4091 domain-containing protein [Candidatus Brocadiia bacterium]
MRNPFQILTVGLVMLGSFQAGADDGPANDAGVPWIHTTDDWGRPWGDACSDFYRRAGAQFELLARQGVPSGKAKFLVGVESPLQKVFMPKIWFKGAMDGVASLSAAKGEYEGFQLVVCPLAQSELGQTYFKWDPQAPFQPATVKIESVRIGALKLVAGGGEIGPEAFTVHRVGYIRTVQPQYPVELVGMWPDPLLPMEAFEVSNPNCQPLWIEVKIPRDAQAGDYEGEIAVVGPHEVRICVKLRVWNFALPETPSIVTMGWQEPQWAVADGRFETAKRILTPLLDHRLCPWHVGQRMSKNLEEHDKTLEWLFGRGVKMQAMSTNAPEAEYIEHLRKKDWLGRFICIPGDEPHEREYPEYKKRADEIRAKFPGLKIAMTEPPRPEARGLFDFWILEPSAQREEWVKQARARGEQVWWYLCQLPINDLYPGAIHRCPGVVVDRPAIDHRVIYWLAYKYGIDGVSFWAIAGWPAGWEKWPGEPWPVNERSKYPYSGQHNANGFLCYPYKDALIPSMRLKSLRDGMEDYDMLTMLAEIRSRHQTGGGKDAGGVMEEVERMLAIPAEVAVGLRYFNKDHAALTSAREKLAGMIEKTP